MASGVGHEAIRFVRQKLVGEDRPFVLRDQGHRLTVTPTEPNSFEVILVDDEVEATVCACGWHAHFDDAQQAAHCLLWLLTPYYRVVEEYRRKTLTRAWIERYEATGWEQIGADFRAVFRILFPGPPYRKIYQQAVLSPPIDLRERCPGIELDENDLPLGSTLGMRVEKL